ncbi:ribosomal-protein-alanine N-acetyltransferase [Atractiella rhizophila]|nr:ribosomal-protein-alanine N-acetyltransferase [Atractiella rhizophila]
MSVSGQPDKEDGKQRPLITYTAYNGETELPAIISLIQDELSEPYVIYTYRYFLHGWPQLCFMAYDESIPVGTIVCKQDIHRGKLNRGYIAMLSVQPTYRGQGIASKLVGLAIERMELDGAQEIILETEVDNANALALYQKLGFIREKRLFRFYLNAKDAFRLCYPIGAPEWDDDDIT